MKRLLNLILLLFFKFSFINAQPGSIDGSFQTDFDFKNTDRINSVAIQPDHKIILGGNFSITFLNGDTIGNLVRLHPDGPLDLSFRIGKGFDENVEKVILQPDGKLIVKGNFSHFNEYPCEQLVRINADGSQDESFSLSHLFNSVTAISIEGNKIIVAGYDLLNHSILLRLDLNGNIDTTFKKCEIEGVIFEIINEPNGKIIIRGSFIEINEVTCRSLARINKDGSIDRSFKPPTNLTYFGQNTILQRDGKILLKGIKNLINGADFPMIRLANDGNYDNSFYINKGIGKEGTINTFYLQKDGKIILGGGFNTFDNFKNKNIVRLNSDGSFDSTFKTGDGFDNNVLGIDEQMEGKLIVTGFFNTFNTFLASRIVRINTDDINQELSFNISNNPGEGIFKINASQSLKLITVTDALGKEILRTEPAAFDATIDITNKSSGLYFVRVFTENESKCVKVFKR